MTIRPLAGIRLQVVNGEGQVHAETVASSDGYFMFDTVFPGRWQVRIAPGQSYRGIELEARGESLGETGGGYRPIEVRLTRDRLRSEEIELLVGRILVEDDQKPALKKEVSGLANGGREGQSDGPALPGVVSTLGDAGGSGSVGKEGGAISTASGKALVENFLALWKKAWASRDIATYLSLYDESFSPPGKKTRVQWQSERRARLRKPKFIDIQLDNVAVSVDRDGVWRVEVDQRYSSDILKDRCRKVLEVRRGEGGMKIIREETLGEMVN